MNWHEKCYSPAKLLEDEPMIKPYVNKNLLDVSSETDCTEVRVPHSEKHKPLCTHCFRNYGIDTAIPLRWGVDIVLDLNSVYFGVRWF